MFLYKLDIAETVHTWPKVFDFLLDPHLMLAVAELNARRPVKEKPSLVVVE